MIKLFKPKWKIIKTIWPYPEGYGAYKEDLFGKRTIISTGLTKEQALEEAKQLNNG